MGFQCLDFLCGARELSGEDGEVVIRVGVWPVQNGRSKDQGAASFGY